MDEFWNIVGATPLCDEGDVERALGRISNLVSRLAPYELIQFQERLHELLFRLDRKDLAEIRVVREGWVPSAQTSDHFLYARCACILAGEAAYEAAMQESAEFERFVKPCLQGAELLLYVADQAYEEKMGWRLVVEEVYPLDWMSNPEGWPGRSPTDTS